MQTLPLHTYIYKLQYINLPWRTYIYTKYRYACTYRHITQVHCYTHKGRWACGTEKTHAFTPTQPLILINTDTHKPSDAHTHARPHIHSHNTDTHILVHGQICTNLLYTYTLIIIIIIIYKPRYQPSYIYRHSRDSQAHIYILTTTHLFTYSDKNTHTHTEACLNMSKY